MKCQIAMNLDHLAALVKMAPNRIPVMHRYSAIFLALMIPLTLVGARGPVLLFLIVAIFLVALAQPLWVFVLRPLAYFAGMVKPNAYDWEVIAWKEERAGRLAEALQAYNNALMLDLGNEIIWARRDSIIERLKSPDAFYFPPPEDLDQG
jgi:hypothetical protein